MDIKYLLYFKLLAEKLHYGKTAEELFITQSTLSYAMDKLEKEIGAPLFKKRGRNIVLSSSGKLFYQRVSNALQEIQSGINEVKDNYDSSARQITVSTVRTMLTNDLVCTFFSNKEYANINLRINQATTEKIFQDLSAGMIDIGFCSYVVNNSCFTFIPCIKQHLVAMVPAKYEKIHTKDSLDLKDLADYPLIIPTGLDEIHWQVIKYFTDNGIVPYQPCMASSTNAAVMLAKAGEGIAIVVKSPILDFFQVKEIPIISPACDMYLYLAYVKNRFRPKALSDFICFIEKLSSACDGKMVFNGIQNLLDTRS